MQESLVGLIVTILFFSDLILVLLGVIIGYFAYRYYQDNKVIGNKIKIFIQIMLLISCLIFVSLGSMIAEEKNDVFGDKQHDTPSDIGFPATDLFLRPVYNLNGSTEVQITNKGEYPINTSNWTFEMKTDSSQEFRSYSDISEEWKLDNQSLDCFNDSINGSIIETGERITCSTGIRFPDKGETLEIKAYPTTYGEDLEFTYTCEVESTDARTC